MHVRHAARQLPLPLVSGAPVPEDQYAEGRSLGQAVEHRGEARIPFGPQPAAGGEAGSADQQEGARSASGA